LFAGRRLMVDWTETRLFLALALVLLLSIPWALAVSRRLANRAEPSTH
jgi:4-amino-4-deoxy-L-arabinose transferase-like glycosyltransferase